MESRSADDVNLANVLGNDGTTPYNEATSEAGRLALVCSSIRTQVLVVVNVAVAVVVVVAVVAVCCWSCFVLVVVAAVARKHLPDLHQNRSKHRLQCRTGLVEQLLDRVVVVRPVPEVSAYRSGIASVFCRRSLKLGHPPLNIQL